MSFVFEGFQKSEEPSDDEFVFEGFEEKQTENKNDIGRLAAQAGIGLGKGALYASPAGVPLALSEVSFHPTVQNVISELLESDLEHQQMYPGEFPALNREQLQIGADQAEQKAFNGEGITGAIAAAPFRAAGMDTTPRTAAEKSTRGVTELLSLLRSGKLDADSLKKNIGGALSGEATKESLESLGLPEWFSSLFGIGVGATVPHLKPSISVPKKTESGLPKLKATESKHHKLATITPQRKEKVLNQLEEDASKLFKEKTRDSIPLIKKIEEGYNFESDFEKRFGQLKETARKANPEIDTTPVNKYLRQSIQEFKGVPSLDKEGASILKEMKAFSKNPRDSLEDLLNIYRSNTRKVKGIYERSKIHGGQEKYINFLNGFNRKIVESFEGTLPENSKWLQEFKGLNSEYREYKNAIKSLNQLEGVLGEKISPSSVRKLANDIKAQKRLSLSLGENAADDIIHLSKDLESAVQAVKKIPVREYAKWEKFLPISLFIPGVGKAFAAYKGVDIARRLYGVMLTSTAKRKLYKEAVSALTNNDMAAYLAATEKLSKSLEQYSDQQ